MQNDEKCKVNNKMQKTTTLTTEENSVIYYNLYKIQQKNERNFVAIATKNNEEGRLCLKQIRRLRNLLK